MLLSLLKAMIPGLIITLVVSAVVGANGSSGGVLYISHMTIHGYDVYGSWNLFFASTGLAWLLLIMMD